MKLSELEKLSDELLSGVPEDMIERNWTLEAIQCLNTLPVFCATFREMLGAMRIANAAIVQYTPCAEEECKQVQTEIGDLAERRLLSAIKKAEEML